MTEHWPTYYYQAQPEGTPAQPPGTAIFAPHDPEGVAEIAQLRRREIMDVRDRLYALETTPQPRWYEPFALVLFGVAGGGVLAGIPVSVADGLPEWVVPVYWVVTIAVLIIGVICLHAGRDIETQRTDSITSVRMSLDNLVGGYRSKPEDYGDRP